MAIRAFRDLDFGIFVNLEHVVFKWRITFTTRGVNAHAANFTFIGSHTNVLVDWVVEIVISIT